MEMPDRERVEKGLNICTSAEPCNGCPYLGERNCSLEMVKDTLALLKEQDVVEPFHKCKGKSFSLIEDSNYDYCPYCGKPITWDKQEGR